MNFLIENMYICTALSMCFILPSEACILSWSSLLGLSLPVKRVLKDINGFPFVNE